MRLAEFEKIADFLGKQHKLQIKEGEGWASNIETRKVFYVKKDIYNLSEDHILGLLLHEIAHIHYTTKTPDPATHKELRHAVLNMVEDISIEHIISGDYPNAGEILKSTETELLDSLVRALPKLKHTPKHEKAMLYGAIRFRGRGYRFPFEDYEKTGEKIADIMKPRAAEIYDRKTTKDLIPLRDAIVDILIADMGEPNEAERRQLGEGEMHGHAKDGKGQTGEAKARAINGLKQGGHGWEGDTPSEGRAKFIDQVADQAALIGKKIRGILKRNNSMEFGGRFRTGKLKPKRIIRIKTSKDRRPFSRRIVKSNQSYAFAIAADVSGSMFGHWGLPDQPGDYTMSSLFMVGEALRKASVPRAMIMFGEKARVITPITKLPIRWSTINDEKIYRKSQTGGTNIGLAMEECIIQLKNIKAERKIMVILTDGSSWYEAMKRAHEKAQKLGIECLGITIGQSPQMDMVFKTDNINIPNDQQYSKIGKAFIDILKKTITKG